MKLPLLLSTFTILSTVTASAQSNLEQLLQMQYTPKVYQAQKANTAITIDGKDSDKAWENIKWTDDYVDIEGDHKPLPKYNTKTKMLWDETYLYIYAQLEEPHIWGDITKHDAIIYHNNDFEVFIKPFENKSHYFEIEVNTLNTIMDLMMPKPYRLEGNAIMHWDTKNIKSAIYHNGTNNNPKDKDKFWAVEMAIPFTSLLSFGNPPFPKENEFWRINFSRVQWQHEIVNGKYQRKKENNKTIHEDNWVWSPIGVVDMHHPERWGFIQFVKNTNDPKSYPKSVDIEKLSWNIFHLQRLHFNQTKRYSKDLSTINGFDQIIGSKIERFQIETILNENGSYFRTEIIDKITNIKTTINNQGNYTIHYE